MHRLHPSHLSPHSAPRGLAVFAFAFIALFASNAFAHDANLARWDIAAQDDTLSMQLRTAGSGLHASLVAAQSTPDADWANMSTQDYLVHLRPFLQQAVVVREDGTALELTDVAYTGGHEVTVTLTFARAQAGPLQSLALDLETYTDRPNQHHLVFISHGPERDRFMLTPDAPATLAWTAEPAAAGESARTAMTGEPHEHHHEHDHQH